MWRAMLKTGLATIAFATLHSLLASRAAKRSAAQVIGQRNRTGLYRVFYIAQSAATFALLIGYIRRQPKREVYAFKGSVALLIHALQAAHVPVAYAAIRQVGVTRITGLESLIAWLGSRPVPAEPEAQGPALDAAGPSRPLGPFAYSRHPLNAIALSILWLQPRMTTNQLAFNAVASAYLVIASFHEESRLRAAYGTKYQAFASSGVPFFLPMPVSRKLHIQQDVSTLTH